MQRGATFGWAVTFGSSIGKKQKLTVLSEFFGNKLLSIRRNIKSPEGGVDGMGGGGVGGWITNPTSPRKHFPQMQNEDCKLILTAEVANLIEINKRGSNFGLQYKPSSGPPGDTMRYDIKFYLDTIIPSANNYHYQLTIYLPNYNYKRKKIKTINAAHSRNSLVVILRVTCNTAPLYEKLLFK